MVEDARDADRKAHRGADRAAAIAVPAVRSHPVHAGRTGDHARDRCKRSRQLGVRFDDRAEDAAANPFHGCVDNRDRRRQLRNPAGHVDVQKRRDRQADACVDRANGDACARHERADRGRFPRQDRRGGGVAERRSRATGSMAGAEMAVSARAQGPDRRQRRQAHDEVRETGRRRRSTISRSTMDDHGHGPRAQHDRSVGDALRGRSRRSRRCRWPNFP